jgi:hypothetical protein
MDFVEVGLRLQESEVRREDTIELVFFVDMLFKWVAASL